MNLTMPFRGTTNTPVNGLASKLDDVRHALSQEADHLAEVAAQFSREAGTHASKLADDAASQAGKVAHDTGTHAASLAHDPVGAASGFAQQLVRGAAEIGTAIAATGRKTARDLGHDAQNVAQDLRQVRITTEAKKTGPDFMPGIALLGGFGAGIALMYFMDPEQGERRRRVLGDRLLSWTRTVTRTANGKAKDLGNRTVGAIHETRKAVQGAMSGTSEEGVDSELSSWQTANGGENGHETSDYGRQAYGTSDPSTTDTWGEQPQPQPSNIEVA